MKITIEAEPKEIADLVLKLQSQHENKIPLDQAIKEVAYAIKSLPKHLQVVEQ